MSFRKSDNFVPEGYSEVCPYLVVESVEKEIEFLEKVFNAVRKDVLKNPQGIIQHGEVRIGEIVIIIGRADTSSQPGQAMNCIYVRNTDEVYEHALKLGATSVEKPDDKFYGYREAAIKDPHGYTWFIAQFLKLVSHEDMEKALANRK